MSGWNFRLAEPSDAEAFSKWVAGNPDIDPRDIEAAKKSNNPSVLYFVIENPEGKAVMFFPIYLSYMLAHMAFDPESRASEKLKAMQVALDGTVAFAAQFGLREITTLTKRGYGVAEWALAHGFEAEDRELFRFDINKVLNKTEESPDVQRHAEVGSKS